MKAQYVTSKYLETRQAQGEETVQVGPFTIWTNEKLPRGTIEFRDPLGRLLVVIENLREP